MTTCSPPPADTLPAVREAFDALRRHLNALGNPDGRFLLDDVETDIARIIAGKVHVDAAGNWTDLAKPHNPFPTPFDHDPGDRPAWGSWDDIAASEGA